MPMFVQFEVEPAAAAEKLRWLEKASIAVVEEIEQIPALVKESI